MKRNAAYIVRMALCVWTGLLILSAQAENVEHENILHVHYGGMWQQDQYLSPLLYSGMGVGIGNEWWQAFRVRKGANNMDSTLYIAHEAKIAKGGWEHMGRVSLQVDWLLNTPKTNRIYALGVQGGWGAYYAWKWTNGSSGRDWSLCRVRFYATIYPEQCEQALLDGCGGASGGDGLRQLCVCRAENQLPAALSGAGKFGGDRLYARLLAVVLRVVGGCRGQSAVCGYVESPLSVPRTDPRYAVSPFHLAGRCTARILGVWRAGYEIQSRAGECRNRYLFSLSDAG